MTFFFKWKINYTATIGEVGKTPTTLPMVGIAFDAAVVIEAILAYVCPIIIAAVIHPTIKQ